MAEEAKKDEKDKKAESAVVEESPEQDAKKRKKKLLLFAIIGVLLIGGGGAGAFFVLVKGKKAAGGEEEISKASVEASQTEDAAHGENSHEGADKKAKDDGHGEAKDKAAAPDEHGGGKADEHAAGKADEHGGKAKTDEHAEKKADADIDFGETFKMQSFNLNLGNALENRYIRIEVSLEYRGGEGQKAEIEKRMPQLRDAVISILQRKTREFLLSPDGKESLRKEILTRINRYMKSRIESVYITDLLIE